MRIEPLIEADLPELAELFTQFWGERSDLPRMHRTFARMSANPSYILLAARDGVRLAGFAMGVVCEELYGDCRPFLVVEDLIVDGAARRRGIGAALMGALEAAARGRRCSQIILVTETDRVEARRFYESQGYHGEAHRGFKKKLG